MTYASESFGGASTPTYLTSTITAIDMTATFHDLTDWVEVDSTGSATTQPLGTSGPFCIKLEWGTVREETVQCSALDPLTGIITFAQRGFDGTTAQAHNATTKANCFPTDTATDWINVHDAISTAVADSADALALAQTADSNASSALSEAYAAQSTADTAEGHAQTALTNAATAQSTADSKVASVTAGDSTITVAGTATAPTVAVNQVNLVITESQVTNLTTDLADKVNTSAIGAVNGVASLDGSGLVPATQIPPIAITETFVVSSQAAMLALTAQVGDVAVRTDIETTFILQSSPASTLANWIKMLTPADGVISVTAGDSTITIGGTATAPTVKVAASGITAGSIGSAYEVPRLTYDAAGRLTAATTNRILTTNAVLTGTATLATGTLYPCDTTSAAFSLTLPGTSTPGGAFIAIQLKAGTNALTINAASGQTINGSLASVKLTTAGQVVYMTYTSAGASWNVIGSSSLVAGANGYVLPANVLTDSTSSTSTTTAATPNAVKSAYDLADTANSSAALKVASVTAGDSSVTVGGTSTAPTVVVAQANLVIAESQVTNLTTDLAGKTPNTRTISTTAPLAGGGDLTANRTLSIADATTSVKGAVQLTDSTSSTSLTTAATANSVKTAYDLANAALPKSGGTMSGAIAMGSQRITGLATAGASTDTARADSVPGNISPLVHGPIAWNYDVAGSSNTQALSLGVAYFMAITVPYGFTLSNFFLAIPATNAGNCTSFLIGLYNTNGALLTSSTPTNYATNINNASGNMLKLAATGSATLTAGTTYVVGFLASGGTTGPSLYANAQSVALLNNLGCPTTSSGKLEQRAATAGTGLTALYNPFNATPAIGNRIFFVGLS